ncbi:MAG: cyclic nucleotide-binding domain-containing protein [Gammaproteobacteria bacterium]|nr:MAG: cyclic nucleotide-binding domain-containing protein [Gammaproteobacteria bacterium]
MTDQLIDQIRNSPLAAELSDDECAVLAGLVEKRKLKNGENLIKEGECEHCLYVVVSGKLGVTRNVCGGSGCEDITLHVLSAGHFAGEMGFVDGMEHTASLQSLGKSEVLALDRQALESQLEAHPHLVYQVMRSIIRSGHDIVRRMNSQYVELTNYITKSHGRY